MDSLDIFISSLQLNNNEKNKLEKFNELIQKINLNTELETYNAQSLLFHIKPSKRLDYIVEHINAFIRSEKTLLLANDLEKYFNFDITNAIKTATIIASDKDAELENFCKNVISMLKNFLNIDENEIINCISTNPKFLRFSMKNYYHNLYYLSNKFNLEKQTLRYIFTHCPLIFAKIDLLSSVKILSKCLSLSTKDFNQFLIDCYKLCFIPATTVRKNIASLIYLFDFSDFEVMTLVRAYPKILLIPQKSLYESSRVLMHNLSLSEKQVKDMLLKYPKLLTISATKLEKKIKSLLSSELFFKKDLKDIVLSSPIVLDLPNNTIAKNILNLSKYFNLNTNSQISKFIHQCPSVLSYTNLKSKIKNLINYQIPIEYIKIAPKVLSSESILAGIKNAMLYPFNLNFELDNILSLDIISLASRIKYLSNNNKNIKDITLSNEIFNLTYHVSSNNLSFGYKTIIDNTKTLIKLSCEKSKNLSTVYTKLNSFLRYDYIDEIKFGLLLLNHDPITNSNKNRYEIEYILSILGLDLPETKYFLNIMPRYINSAMIITNLETLKSFGLSREQIINLIIKKPIILISNQRTLNEKLHELNFEYNDDINQIYNNL